jgi:hypothetical protein
MVDKETGELMVPEDGPVALPRVSRPITPYASPITGEVIEDRRQEREHMAKHGMVHTAEIKKTPQAEKRTLHQEARLAALGRLTGKETR